MTTTSGPDAAGTGRPLALITGVGRSVNIGAAIAAELAGSGWDIAFTYWAAYDERMPWHVEPDAARTVTETLAARGAATAAISADLTDPDAPGQIFDAAEQQLGPVTALIMCHCESVDSGLLDTSVDSFDRHFAVNTRATWLLIREFGLRFRGTPGTGRIIFMTSDHTVGNLPYGASKGAADRIVLASAHELADRGVTANVINPGPVDTGWMTPEIKETLTGLTPLGRLGAPTETARLAGFLCSPEGGWINAQLLYSNGGFRTPMSGRGAFIT